MSVPDRRARALAGEAIFAANMRSSPPNGAFIGFTGTPLMEGEERTKEVLG